MKFHIALWTLAVVFATGAQAQDNKPVDATPAAETAAPAAAPVEQAAPAAAADADTGIAAYYGKKFAGRKTASGQRFNPNAMTAAHRTLPFGTKVRVTNTKNNRKAVVIINDRGPSTQDRIIDVSYAAAKKLGLLKSGLAEVKVEVIGKTKLKGRK